MPPCTKQVCSERLLRQGGVGSMSWMLLCRRILSDEFARYFAFWLFPAFFIFILAPSLQDQTVLDAPEPRPDQLPLGASRNTWPNIVNNKVCCDLCILCTTCTCIACATSSSSSLLPVTISLRACVCVCVCAQVSAQKKF